MKSMVAILKCPDYSFPRISKTIGHLFDLLGGIERFIKPSYKVLVKPNLLSASLAEQGITTHPMIVREVARRIKDIGAKVFIGDSPGGPLNLNEVYEKTGMREIGRELGVELVRFDRIERIKDYPFARAALECDCFISLPKFKTHALTTITAGIKNSFGLVPGIYKTHLHLKFPRPEDFSKIVVDIFAVRPPDLVIVDAVVSMAGEGPAAGILKKTGLILGGWDAVAIDAVLAKIMGIKPSDVLTTLEAFRRNLGEAKLEKIEIRGTQWKDIEVKDFPLPRQTLLDRLPRPVLKFAGYFINTYPAVNNKTCRACRVCIKGCPAEALTIENGITRINRRLCIKCLCCYEFCPHDSVYLKKSLPMKLLGLVRR